MFSNDWPQEIVALVIAGLALAYVVRHFRPQSKKQRADASDAPNARLGRRLQRGLRRSQAHKTSALSDKD